VVEPVDNDHPTGVIREDEPLLHDEPLELRSRSIEKREQASPASSTRSLSPEDARGSRLRARLQAAIGTKNAH
jgi:hypothetical protein